MKIRFAIGARSALEKIVLFECFTVQKHAKTKQNSKEKSNKINTVKPKEKQAISPKFHEKIKQN